MEQHFTVTLSDGYVFVSVHEPGDADLEALGVIAALIVNGTGPFHAFTERETDRPVFVIDVPRLVPEPIR